MVWSVTVRPAGITQMGQEGEMKVINRREYQEPTCKTTCGHCRSDLEVEKSDCKYDGDQRDGGYHFKCPVCSHENWVGHGAFRVCPF